MAEEIPEELLASDKGSKELQHRADTFWESSYLSESSYLPKA